MKKLTLFMLFLYAGMTVVHAQVCTYFVHPNFNNNTISFYWQGTVAGLNTTFNVAADATNAWGSPIGVNETGPNGVLFYKNKIFVSYCNGNKGGVLVYDYSLVFDYSYHHLLTTPPPVEVIKPLDSMNGLATIGMVINPATGDLFIGTAEPGNADAGIFQYHHTANGWVGSQFASFDSDPTVAAFCANLAFDSKGNLWSTTFSTDGNNNDFAPNNYLICYKNGPNGLDKTNYYKLTNPVTTPYTAKDINGNTISNLNLLSAPEGIIFDSSGNLWIGNNNDANNGAADNPAGTLVKVKASWINQTLLTSATSTATQTIPSSQVDIKYIPNGELGGLSFYGNIIYVNDQGNGHVYKWDTTKPFNASNYKQTVITASYPGNGSGSMFNISPIKIAFGRVKNPHF